jgi:methyl-accepting chemotaxis protein
MPFFMIDTNTIITVVPPIITGAFAYFIASRKKQSEERINKAKTDADTQNQALIIVRGVVDDMRNEFRREIDNLKSDNDRLRSDNDKLEEKVMVCNNTILSLSQEIKTQNENVIQFHSEVASLKATIKVYENELARLKHN